jgi:hypothetical protein
LMQGLMKKRLTKSTWCSFMIERNVIEINRQIVSFLAAKNIINRCSVLLAYLAQLLLQVPH